VFVKAGARIGLATVIGALACQPTILAPSEQDLTETTGEVDDTGDLTDATGSTGSATAVCPPPLLTCDEACVDPRWDPRHCGNCERPCADFESCVEGSCTLVCGPGTLACGSECVDVSVDPEHCGACGRSCPEGGWCLDGACILDCEGDETQCGDQCVDLSNDEHHCGGCDVPCDDDVHCVWGQCVDASLHHVLITGQSLSVGQQSVVVSENQPYDNVSFVDGVRAGTQNLSDFVPLVERTQGIFGETIGSGLANLLTEITATETAPGLRLLVSAHGVSSAAYEDLARDSEPYARGMSHVLAASLVAAQRGETQIVRAVVAIHGEADHVADNPFYDDNLLTWQADYQADIQLATGQTLPVPLFLCQISSWTHYGSATSRIPAAQLEASRRNPQGIVLVGPKYFLPYVDGLHLTGDGERQLGEYYAKAMRRVLVDGLPWTPVSPRDVTRSGRFIRVEFHVPVPPLVLDDQAVSDPGNFGFEYTDASDEPPVIEAVELIDETTVQITLSAEPTAGGRRIRYAHTAMPGSPSGAQTGARGNLRDSDETASRHGYPLHNWAVHFDDPAP
jgi:hypothetical protein